MTTDNVTFPDFSGRSPREAVKLLINCLRTNSIKIMELDNKIKALKQEIAELDRPHH